MAAGAAALLGIAYVSADQLGLGKGAVEPPLLVPARLQALEVVVTERGSLESTVTVDGVCELQGRENKIIFLVPEGNRVEKGDIVVRFDSTEIEKNIAQQQIKTKQAAGKVATTRQDIEIQRNEGDSKVSEAKVEHRLAELNLEKYKDGDFQAELADIKGNLAQYTYKLEEATNKRDQIEELVKKGFRTLEQKRAAEQEFLQYKNFVERDQLKLQIKNRYEYQLKTVELQSKVEQAANKIKRAEATRDAQLAKATGEHEAAVATHELEKQQLDEFLTQKARTEIRAEQAGVVAYANEPWYDSSRQIREGAVVYTRQKIFSLPDMTNMQVVVNIHESLVKKVKAGQVAEIRIESFPNLVLAGKVKSVAQLADSNRFFDQGGAKVYKTVVTIERMPEEELRPSMTAEVRIRVRTIPSALVVPIQAVAERRGVHYAYVSALGGSLQRREVKVGETNEKLVQIVDGLREGELVALDARKRLDAETKAEDEVGGAGAGASAPAPTSAESQTPPAPESVVTALPEEPAGQAGD
jgi:RND family efflux transporter MFP subunit